jgi:sugar transferase (PEP-CTERM/EpsH1 system associated)
MKRMLFLCHRIPYPPEKGDKIRAWHMLDHLSKRWEIDLGCLVDDPKDLEHLPVLESRCRTVRAYATGSPWQAAARALMRFRFGQPLTAGWFHHGRLATWVQEGMASGHYDAVFAYSAAMAPYLTKPGESRREISRILDLVDVDSEKWRSYANNAALPMRYVWAREARTLLAFERRMAMDFDKCIFVSEQESARFAEIAPETKDRLGWIENGVDMSFFDSRTVYPDPYSSDKPVIVFTGTMDYRPNVEAVSWFAREVMPRLRGVSATGPSFSIVGANPSPAVRALGNLPGVRVVGPVPDIRPYIAHASLAVAPLRIARGIQNKVLEAMALGKPVVASSAAFEGVHAVPGRDILVADGLEHTVSMVKDVLQGAYPDIGASARKAMLRGHDWSATLGRLDEMLLKKPAVTPSRSLGFVA